MQIDLNWFMQLLCCVRARACTLFQKSHSHGHGGSYLMYLSVTDNYTISHHCPSDFERMRWVLQDMKGGNLNWSIHSPLIIHKNMQVTTSWMSISINLRLLNNTSKYILKISAIISFQIKHYRQVSSKAVYNVFYKNKPYNQSRQTESI